MHASTSPGLTISVNGAARAIASGRTVADLVRDLALEGKRIAVELNGEIVPRSRYEATRLSAGDRLEIVGAVGGG
jgi:sulfur carrier protein